MKRFICILLAYVLFVGLFFALDRFAGPEALGILTLACAVGGFLFLYQNVGWTFTIFWGDLLILGIIIFILKLAVCVLIGIFVTPYKIGSGIANLLE